MIRGDDYAAMFRTRTGPSFCVGVFLIVGAIVLGSFVGGVVLGVVVALHGVTP